MKKCLHVVVIGDDYLVELRKLTMPTIIQYAEKIGADLNIITTRKYPEWPITYEKTQIYEMGKGYDWNICVDLDTIIHPDLYDVTTQYSKDIVGINFAYHASTKMIFDKYFMRDGRNVGVSTNFIVSSDWTHDLWEPFDIPFDEAKKYVNRLHCIDEYCVSRNLAKYGLKYAGAAPTPEKQKLIFHVSAEGQDEQASIISIREYMREMDI